MLTESTVRALSERNRQDAWRERLQEFASNPPEKMGDEWGVFLKELGLTQSYFLAVHEVLKQGRWKTALHQSAYVKKAAMTEARKMHLSIPHLDDTFELGKSPLVFMGGNELNRGTTRKGIEAALGAEYREYGKPHPTRIKGRHFVAEQFDPDEEVLWKEEQAREIRQSWPSDCWAVQQISKGLLSALKAHYADNPDEFLAWKISLERRDWKKLGKKAGLDPGEAKVLQYRADGISREQAMEQQRSEVARKAIQAAWKRFDRTGKKKKSGMERVQLFLTKNVPDEHSQDTRDIEAYAPAHPRSAISGNPLQTAWKRTGGTTREDLGSFLSKYRGLAFGRGATPLVTVANPAPFSRWSINFAFSHLGNLSTWNVPND